MSWPWTLWVLVILLSFGALETWAYRTGKPTLSLFMATLGREFPPLLVLYGTLFGALAIHFWWHWGCAIAPGAG